MLPAPHICSGLGTPQICSWSTLVTVLQCYTCSLASGGQPVQCLLLLHFQMPLNRFLQFSDLPIVGLKTLSSCLCIFQLCQSSIPSVGQRKMNQSVTVSHTSCLDEAFEFDLKRNLKLQNYPLQHRAAKSSLGNCFALFAHPAQNVKALCERCITYTRHEAHRSLISLNECTVHAFVTRPYMYV